MSDEVNKRVGDYEILGELGAGGMGRVYRVRNVITDRVEAMKVLLPDLAGRQELAARFQREIKVLASLNHPNIASLRTALTVDNQLLMIMEYVEGTSLAVRLEHGPISVADSVSYIDQVLSALSYAHQQHIIHRDIKPANMMLTPQGVVKLMDFGIARSGEESSLTMTGMTLGSLSYMSPEQVTGEGIDARSDLYSLGVSLYEMVTGRRPFQAQSDYSIMAAQVKEAPKPPMELMPGIPETLNEIILIAIAKDPAQRFQSADAFRNALSSVVVSTATAAAPSLPAAVAAGAIAPPSPVTSPAVTLAATQAMTPPPATTVSAVKIPMPISTPAAMPMPSPVPASGHRGLYMTLGALIVLVGLVVAGIYVPRYRSTHADPTRQPMPSKTANDVAAEPSQPQAPAPAQNPASTPAISDANLHPSAAISPAPVMPEKITPASEKVPLDKSSKTGEAAPMKPPTKPSGKATASNRQTPQSDGMATMEVPATPPPAPDEANMDEMEHEIDLLSNRAAAVNGSLDRLQQQQSAAGYGLRGDMAAKQASMKNNLSKAQDAVEHGDAARAKRYMTMAEGDVEALEHFLGH